MQKSQKKGSDEAVHQDGARRLFRRQINHRRREDDSENIGDPYGEINFRYSLYLYFLGNKLLLSFGHTCQSIYETENTKNHRRYSAPRLEFPGSQKMTHLRKQHRASNQNSLLPTVHPQTRNALSIAQSKCNAQIH